MWLFHMVSDSPSQALEAKYSDDHEEDEEETCGRSATLGCGGREDGGACGAGDACGAGGADFLCWCCESAAFLQRAGTQIVKM
jgi:hypothetical protein